MIPHLLAFSALVNIENNYNVALSLLSYLNTFLLVVAAELCHNDVIQL